MVDLIQDLTSLLRVFGRDELAQELEVAAANSALLECKDCSGSGRCQHCNGEGVVDSTP